MNTKRVAGLLHPACHSYMIQRCVRTHIRTVNTTTAFRPGRRKSSQARRAGSLEQNGAGKSGGRRGMDEEAQQEYCEGARFCHAAGLSAAGCSQPPAESQVRQV